jgi:hypothetical protein
MGSFIQDLATVLTDDYHIAKRKREHRKAILLFALLILLCLVLAGAMGFYLGQ